MLFVECVIGLIFVPPYAAFGSARNYGIYQFATGKYK